jgi:hypothetical protein
MIKLKWLVAVAMCCLAIGPGPASACQYNVREVGFIDTGIEPYRLIVYLPENISASGVSDLKEAMAPALADTNIRFEPVTIGGDANLPALEFVRAQGISRFPAVVLVSPDGQSMPVALPEKAASLAEAVSTAVQSIVDSPTRREILEKCADSYGVALLVEGPEPQANTMARQAISAALSQVGEQLGSLPKPISKPPELVVLDRKSLARERMLLWTLGLKAQDVNQPHAAVFYGRGRWLGPVFKGGILSEDNLTQLLSIIGADCECSLDHRWLQGTMLPARWDETLQQKVVQSVGFDPENPMTKAEMVSIVRRSMGGADSPPATGGAGESSGYPSVLVDYREIQVGGDAKQGEGQKTAPSSDVSPAASRIVGQALVGSLAGVVVLAVVASFVIVLRARKQ